MDQRAPNSSREKTTMITRRDLLKLTAGASALGLAGKCLPAIQAATGNKIPIGLELWSVRAQCEKELPIVLEAVAKMGYEAVELAHSYYGHDAPSWRKLLDKNGLKSCGMHMGLPALTGDELEKTVGIHKMLGTPYLIVASLPKKNVESVSALKETAKLFNKLAEQLKPHGMQIGYHCHGGDFEAIEGTTPWECLAENTAPDVIMQLDMGNCLGGGGDPIAMLKKFPGRSTSVHLKDAGGVFGEGTVNWDEVFAICESTGGTKQYVIEEESRSGPEALADCELAIKNFRKMGK
jgi:sugar phosphate isomerase/epimerase